MSNFYRMVIGFLIIIVTSSLVSCGGGSSSSIPEPPSKSKFNKLNIVFSGSGSGKITLIPSNKICSIDCSDRFPTDNKVKLIPTTDIDSSFKGFGGDSDCYDGEVTMNKEISCSPVFDIKTDVKFYDLNITVVGDGAIASSDLKIKCTSAGEQSCVNKYIVDTPVTLTPAATNKSIFSAWSGDPECTANTTGEVALVSITKTLNCTATFVAKPKSVTLTISLSGSRGSGVVASLSSPKLINCGSQCDGVYTLDDVVTLRATPAFKNDFISWGADCGSSSNTNAIDTKITMNMDKICTAIFEPKPTAVLNNLSVSLAGPGKAGGRVISIPNGIDCETACSYDFTKDSTVILKASSIDTTSVFTGWGGDCGLGTLLSHDVILNTPMSCIANFDVVKPVTYLLSIQTNGGSGAGSVTSNPAGINCGGTCSSLFEANIPITLMPLEGKNSVFVSWVEKACANGTVTLTNANQKCTAIFNLIPVKTYNVTALIDKTSTGTGKITANSTLSCGVNCWTYNSGDTAVLTATNTNGNSSWAGVGCQSTGNTPTNNATITAITVNTNCTVTFTKNITQTYTLNLLNTGTGSGTFSPSNTTPGITCGPNCWTYNSGDTVQLTASAANGSTFLGWITWAGNVDTCTSGKITMTGNNNCIANFTKDSLTSFDLTAVLAGYNTGSATITADTGGKQCIVSNPGYGIYCWNYPNNATATLTASWNGPNIKFGGWSGTGCIVSGPSDTTATVTINSAKTCVATFTP